jgi:hypothetical protein
LFLLSFDKIISVSNIKMNGPGYIMSQEDIQKILINRGGNRVSNVDFWEGFKDKKKKATPEDMMNGLPRDAPQVVVASYLRDRGGNRGPSQSIKSPKENFEDVSQPKYVDDEFYKGDKILSGNFFDGWNDTYFFNTSIFRENLEFWQNPFTFLKKK